MPEQIESAFGSQTTAGKVSDNHGANSCSILLIKILLIN
jgi:hypothetical protein